MGVPHRDLAMRVAVRVGVGRPASAVSSALSCAKGLPLAAVLGSEQTFNHTQYAQQ